MRAVCIGAVAMCSGVGVVCGVVRRMEVVWGSVGEGRGALGGVGEWRDAVLVGEGPVRVRRSRRKIAPRCWQGGFKRLLLHCWRRAVAAHTPQIHTQKFPTNFFSISNTFFLIPKYFISQRRGRFFPTKHSSVWRAANCSRETYRCSARHGGATGSWELPSQQPHTPSEYAGAAITTSTAA